MIYEEFHPGSNVMIDRALPPLGTFPSLARLSALRTRFCSLVARWGGVHVTPSLIDFVSHAEPSSNTAPGLALLVTDLADFTPMVERLGDSRACSLMRLHNRLLREQVRRHDGMEVTHTGDGIMACFRSARAAVQCAMRIQARVAALNSASELPALHLRIGIHQGAPLVEEDRLFGAAVVAAVRICQDCAPDHILASRSVYVSARNFRQRFRSQGLCKLKGFSERFELFEVSWGSRSAVATD